MIDADGEWREVAGGKARELVAPSEEWLQRTSEDPDAARIYAEVQARLAPPASAPAEEPTTEGN